VNQTNGDLFDAIALYERNIVLSEAFYPSLQNLEICLRNRLHQQMVNRFGEDWFSNNVCSLQIDSLREIEKAKQRLNNKEEIISDDIVAQLNFGFWVSLLGTRYDADIWRQALYLAFPNARRLKRKVIHNRLNMLRRLRNRIAHHEPIFDRPLAQDHTELIETIGWMCTITSEWTKQQSRLPELLQHST